MGSEAARGQELGQALRFPHAQASAQPSRAEDGESSAEPGAASLACTLSFSTSSGTSGTGRS